MLDGSTSLGDATGLGPELRGLYAAPAPAPQPVVQLAVALPGRPGEARHFTLWAPNAACAVREIVRLVGRAPSALSVKLVDHGASKAVAVLADDRVLAFVLCGLDHGLLDVGLKVMAFDPLGPA